MAWPMSQDYNEASQDASCLADAELSQAEVVTNALGLPVPCSGNFADVYAVKSGQRKWAVKCFTREIPGLAERYVEISNALQRVQLPCMVDFKFLQQGIRVRGQWYPILKMHWVEGFSLNTFVKNNLDKPAVLQTLCQIWLKLASRLRETGMAHGDLQHGNVMLVPGSKAGALSVRLVDYDGMYVPALELLKTVEVAHPCYQHPQRQRESVWNIEVEGEHCYRVGEQGLLVHNASVPNPCPAQTTVIDAETTSDSVMYQAEMVTRTMKLTAIVVKGEPKKEPFDLNWPKWWYTFTGSKKNEDVGPRQWRKGHILGDVFGGPGKKTAWNFAPQALAVNNGIYRTCEYEIERALCGCGCVVLEVEIQYSNEPDNLVRPEMFWFSVTTGAGKIVDRQPIDNTQRVQFPTQCSKSPPKPC